MHINFFVIVLALLEKLQCWDFMVAAPCPTYIVSWTYFHSEINGTLLFNDNQYGKKIVWDSMKEY